MADLYDCSDPDARAAGLDAAATAISDGRLVLLPTDTVYGVAADAFTPAAVTGLLAAKNRGRAMPVPVLCAVNGVAAGAGANFALCWDIVLAARSASFPAADRASFRRARNSWRT